MNTTKFWELLMSWMLSFCVCVCINAGILFYTKEKMSVYAYIYIYTTATCPSSCSQKFGEPGKVAKHKVRNLRGVLPMLHHCKTHYMPVAVLRVDWEGDLLERKVQSRVKKHFFSFLLLSFYLLSFSCFWAFFLLLPSPSSYGGGTECWWDNKWPNRRQ